MPQSYGRYKFSEKTQYKVLSNYNFAGFCGVAFIGESRKEKLVRISVSGPTNIPVTVKVDRTHFANVLNTIIDNAIKYSGDSVDIEIECLKDRIKISDNGIGIPSKSLPYIFDRFYRVPHGNIQDVHGYGIGLYYARQMLDKMGCSIKAESKVGHGTIFTIIFSEDEK